MRIMVGKLLEALKGKRENISELTIEDFIKANIVTGEGKRKSLSGLLGFIERGYSIKSKEALDKIKELLGVKKEPWIKNDWDEVRRKAGIPIPEGNEAEIKEFLINYHLKREEQTALGLLINGGRGNKAALKALMWPNYNWIAQKVRDIVKTYNFDSASLMDYVMRRVYGAALKYDGGKASFHTHFARIIHQARYDYYVVLAGLRRKGKAREVLLRQAESQEHHPEQRIADRPHVQPLGAEEISNLNLILTALWIKERDRKIYIEIVKGGKTQWDVAEQRNLSEGRISQIHNHIKQLLDPYENMVQGVFGGNILLHVLLDKIRKDRRKAAAQAQTGSRTDDIKGATGAGNDEFDIRPGDDHGVLGKGSGGVDLRHGQSQNTRTRKKDQSIILDADALIQYKMAGDLEDTVRDIIAKHGLLGKGKIFLYYGDSETVEAVEKMVKRAGSNLPVIKISKEKIGKRNSNSSEAKETKKLLAEIRANGGREVLAYIRGPVKRSPKLQEELHDLADISRDDDIPILIIGGYDTDYEKGIYSFREALKKALKLKARNNKNARIGYVFMLMPAGPLTPEFVLQHDRYLRSVGLTGAAA